MRHTKQKSDQAPGELLIADIPKNARGERLRIRLTTYGGRRCCDVRTWYQDASGELQPSKGSCFRAELLPDVAGALTEALKVWEGEEE
jgi:hypothetical protein